MRESYEIPKETVGSSVVDDVRDSTFSITIEATARYTGYRRFQVTTDEVFR
jgi:hypothetical protein